MNQVGSIFYSVVERDLSATGGTSKARKDREFSRLTELEMGMARDRERSEQKKRDEALALKTVQSTPRIAGVGNGGMTPRRTPRRVGL
jgi:pre-mRNA-splicing factor ATP-dependent RNA helicase DHX38/PRP16